MAYPIESEQLTTADRAKAAEVRRELTGQTEERGSEAKLSTDGKASADGKVSEEQRSTPLLPGEFSHDMRTRWETIQTGFVDDPRVAVQQADELVASAIKKLAESFTAERSKLEGEWSKGKDVSTENLRQALRRYRAFFQRLLAI